MIVSRWRLADCKSFAVYGHIPIYKSKYTEHIINDFIYLSVVDSKDCEPAPS